MTDTDKITELLTFAHQLADAAARATLPLFRNLQSVDNKLADKGGFDPVTQADREAEQAIRTLIETHYPTHAIIGEEFGTKAGDNFQWVIDPIDGTRAFMSGIPTWGTLIGLNIDAQPMLAMMDQAFTGERYFAAEGLGGFLRHDGQTHPLQTRACASLEEAVLATTTPAMFADTPAAAMWERTAHAAKLTRYGGDCYNYALLALGQVDIVIEQGLKDVDIQPLVQLIQQAGGVVTDWQGEPAHFGGTALACGDPQLHAKMLAWLN